MGEEGRRWGAPAGSRAPSGGSAARRALGAQGRQPVPSTQHPGACGPPRTHLAPWVFLAAPGGRGTSRASRPPEAQPLRCEDPAARHLLCPPQTLRITAAPGWSAGPGLGRHAAGEGAGGPRSTPGENTWSPREVPQGTRAPKAPEPRGPRCPVSPFCPVSPTWLALWNCFFSPATDIAAAPGRGVDGLWARPGHAATTRGGSGPRALGSAGPASHGHGHSRCHTRTHARTQLATLRAKAPAQPIGRAAAVCK